MDQFNAWGSAQAAAKAAQNGSSSQHYERLKDKVVLVCDASTTVGSGITCELLKEGAVVVAPLRSESAVDQLFADCAGAPTDSLHAIIADVATEAGCAAFVAEALQRHGEIHHAVSCFGSFWSSGMLTEQPVQELQRVLSETLVRHFVWAKHVLPALKPSPAASALFISEGAGNKMVGPDTSLWTVAASSVFGLILAAQDEYRDSPLRINEMRLHCFLKRHSDIGGKNSQVCDFYGKKAYSNRKLGKIAADVLLSSKFRERIEVTPTELDGEALTV